MERIPERLPDWLKRKTIRHSSYSPFIAKLRKGRLHTVCESARCPNLQDCFKRGFATFLILGDICSRRCSFCGIKKGKPMPIDPDEPKHIAEFCVEMGIRHAVITSVTRDDLPDGGASQFVEVIRTLKESGGDIRVEVLIPDFNANFDALQSVIDASPDILSHNIETVERLYPVVRNRADYNTSLSILREAKRIKPLLTIKSGLMVGLGESCEEVKKTMMDIVDTGCDILTIGQYLRPSSSNIPVMEYFRPEYFEQLREYGIDIGFKKVFSAPLVRSSFMAEEVYYDLA